jgi:hypothetical protein
MYLLEEDIIVDKKSFTLSGAPTNSIIMMSREDTDIPIKSLTSGYINIAEEPRGYFLRCVRGLPVKRPGVSKNSTKPTNPYDTISRYLIIPCGGVKQQKTDRRSGKRKCACGAWRYVLLDARVKRNVFEAWRDAFSPDGATGRCIVSRPPL